jgi:hypothetical protein
VPQVWAPFPQIRIVVCFLSGSGVLLPLPPTRTHTKMHSNASGWTHTRTQRKREKIVRTEGWPRLRFVFCPGTCCDAYQCSACGGAFLFVSVVACLMGAVGCCIPVSSFFLFVLPPSCFWGVFSFILVPVPFPSFQCYLVCFLFIFLSLTSTPTPNFFLALYLSFSMCVCVCG